MDVETIIYDIKTHPLLIVVILFVVVLVGSNLFRKSVVATPTTPTDTPTPIVEKTYQVFNQYPTTPPPTVIPPVVPPVVDHKPPNEQPVPPKPGAKPMPKVGPKKTVTVRPWPDKLSTLWGIAQANGISLSQIEHLNPQFSSNWNLIHVGNQVRVS